MPRPRNKIDYASLISMIDSDRGVLQKKYLKICTKHQNINNSETNLC